MKTDGNSGNFAEIGQLGPTKHLIPQKWGTPPFRADLTNSSADLTMEPS